MLWFGVRMKWRKTLRDGSAVNRTVKNKKCHGGWQVKISSGRLKPMIKLSNKSNKHSTTILSSATVIVNHKGGKLTVKIPFQYTKQIARVSKERETEPWLSSETSARNLPYFWTAWQIHWFLVRHAPQRQLLSIYLQLTTCHGQQMLHRPLRILY
jgi:hypothetical protein